MRKALLVLVLVVALVGASPGLAFGWANGPVHGGYGSHDWILDRAITLAGAQGSWVQRTIALRATSDPDTRKWAATYQHYFETGSCRGGPQMVAELYHSAMLAYQAGDLATASKLLGQLSHCYSDSMQPFHATQAANAYKSLHTKYEYAVDALQRGAKKSRSWVKPAPRVPVTDVRDKAVAAAMYGRSFFPSLVKTFKKSRSVKKGTPNRITKALMNRAANDLADIIVSIPLGVGETAAPVVDMKLSRTTLRTSERIGALVTVMDANGRPLNAVGVKFVWMFPSGPVTWSTYTDANGYIYRYQDVTSAAVGQPTLASTFVTVNGATTASTLSYVVTR